MRDHASELRNKFQRTLPVLTSLLNYIETCHRITYSFIQFIHFNCMPQFPIGLMMAIAQLQHQ